MRYKFIIIWAILLVFIYSAEYHVDTEADNEVKFISKTTLEEFEGITNQIDGYVVWENEILQANKFYMEVPLETLDTGIGLRNRHMRHNSLETDKYPFAKYQGSIITADTTENDTLNLRLKGEFTIHGVTQMREIDVKAVQNSEGYVANADFNINMKNYNINVPDVMIMKVNENIMVKVQVYFYKVEE